MKHPLRYAGAAGFLITLGIMIFSAADGVGPQSAVERTQDPGFGVGLENLGRAQTVIRGELDMRGYRAVPTADGGKLRVPSIRVTGHDPEPTDVGDWMRCTDVRITPFEADGKTVSFRVSCPEARIALVGESDRPKPDMRRRWLMVQPLLRSTRFGSGKELVLRADSAEIDPQSGELFTAGPFELLMEGLEVRGHGLRTEPETGRVYFGETGRGDALEWVLETAEGRVFHGRSDSNGVFARQGEGAALLELHAVEASSMVFPPDSPLPGELASRGMRLWLESRETGWEPVRAEGLESTRWRGSNAWLVGGAWSGRWFGEEFQGLAVAGPLRALFRAERPIRMAAGGGAFVAPLGGEVAPDAGEPAAHVYLHGGAYLDDLENRIHAAWIDWDPAAQERALGGRETPPVAGGGFYLESPQGSAFSRSAARYGRDGWRLDGAVVIYPKDARGDRVTASTARLAGDGSLLLDGGFTVRGMLPGGPARLEGNRLALEQRRSVARSRATGNVRVTTADASFLGRELFVVSGEREQVELVGDPATAETVIESGERISSRAGRMVLADQELFLSQEPVILIPASALQLEGEDVLLRSPRMRRREDGAWVLSGGVTFSGGLEGRCATLEWTEDKGMHLRAGGEVGARVTLSGRRTDAGNFLFEARNLFLDPNGTIRLDGTAVAELSGGEWELGGLAGSTDRIRLEGENGQIAGNGGFFDLGARLTAGQLVATAHRIDWLAADGRPTSITLRGDAEVDSPEATGRGETINYRVADSNLRLDGAADRPAVLTLAQGRTVIGEWLEMDLVNYLVSAGPGSSHEPRP